MDKFEISDILASLDAWEKSRREFLSNLARAKQPEPPAESMRQFRDVFIESFLLGRASK